jgi:hypothetical protein
MQQHAVERSIIEMAIGGLAQSHRLPETIAEQNQYSLVAAK